MKILVTGGAGFIGANLIGLLLDSTPFEVTVLDNLSATGTFGTSEDSRATFVEGDVTDAGLLNRIVPGHDAVVHLAAQAGVPASLADPRRDCEVNILGTLSLLEAAQISGVSRFVFASSNAPLGRQAPPAVEDKAALPMSPYGASKLAGEAYCLAYHGSWGLGTVALRFSNVYGVLSMHKKSVVSRFFHDAHTTGRITIEGTGEQTRDFVYVEDLCQAILLALSSDIGGEVFQIGTGVETSINQLAKLVGEIVGSGIEVERTPGRAGDIVRSYSSYEKARALLNWEPATRLDEGLRATWSWMMTQDALGAPQNHA